AVDLLHQPDELDVAAPELAASGDDLGPLAELPLLHPEVQGLARGFLVRRGRHFAQALAARPPVAEGVEALEIGENGHGCVDVVHGEALPTTPACRRNRFRNTPKGVNRLLRLSSARTIGSRETAIRA